MSVLSSLEQHASRLPADLAIERAAANTLVLVKGERVFVNEQSMVAVVRLHGARRMLTMSPTSAGSSVSDRLRTPRLRPMTVGVDAVFDALWSQRELFL